MKVLSREIRLVTEKEFDELVWKRDINFHFICYSKSDGGYVACFHNDNGSNYTSDEAYDNIEDAIEWINEG